MTMIDCTFRDRFFYNDKRVRLVAYNPRDDTYSVEFIRGGENDGQRLNGVDRDDIRFHWDCPKDHPDW